MSAGIGTCSNCGYWTRRTGNDFGICNMPGDGDLPQDEDSAVIEGDGRLCTRDAVSCNEWVDAGREDEPLPAEETKP